MLLMPNDVAAAHQALVKAIENKQLSEQRVDESVKRILGVKYDAGMLQ